MQDGEKNRKKKNRKKKKSRKGRLIVMLIVAAGAASLCGYVMKEQGTRKEQTGQSSITAGEGQSLVYGQIDTITGNEIMIKLIDKKEEKNGIKYEKNGEEEEYRIPVGTEVETALGNMITFSRLSSGDRIAMLFEGTAESENLLKIWMIGGRDDGFGMDDRNERDQ